MRLAMAALFLAGGMLGVFRGEPGAAVFWCEKALPLLRGGLACLSGRIPFPLAEAFLIALPLWILCGHSRRRRLAEALAAVLLALTCTWFPLCIAQARTVPAEIPDAAALSDLCARLSGEAAAQRVSLPEDARGRVLLPWTQRDLLREAARLCESGGVPKASRCPELMAALGVSGWWSPVTGEAVVDCALPAAALPFTLCHELAHARGVVGEAEANLFAWEACARGPDAFRYSGTVSALWYALGALREADEAAWRNAISGLDAVVSRDLRAMNALSDREETPLERLQDRLTALYLRCAGAGDYAAFLAWIA